VGDTVEVAFMTGLRETHEMAVTGLVEQYLGLGAYADIDFLDAQFRRSEQMSVVNVLIDPRVPARPARRAAGDAGAVGPDPDDGEPPRLRGHDQPEHRRGEQHLRGHRDPDHRGRGL
jgi:hypothetical protein